MLQAKDKPPAFLSVGYAYPSSPLARQLLGAAEGNKKGAWFFYTHDDRGADRGDEQGPFDSCALACRKAREAFPALPWSFGRNDSLEGQILRNWLSFHAGSVPA